MRLTKEEVRAIERGAKTMHRVLVTTPQTTTRPGPRGTKRTGQSATMVREPFRPRVGHEYHAGRLNIGGEEPRWKDVRVKMLEVRKERLGDITFKDVRAEGHRTSGLYKAAWVRRYDAAWIKHHHVELAAAFDTDSISVVDWILCERFDRRWADKLVWVMSFVRTADTRQLLADVRKGRGDYTASPGLTIDRGAEAVDELTQRRLSEKAAKEAERKRAADRRAAGQTRAQGFERVDSLSNRDLRRVGGYLERMARRAA